MSDALKTSLEEAIAACGFVLWGHRLLKQGQKTVLMVWMDGEDKDVSASACAEVSSQLSDVLLLKFPKSSQWRIEVSSPGLERVFFEPEQYEAFVGQRVKVNTHAMLDGKKTWEGVLASVSEAGVALTLDDEGATNPHMEIAFSNIKKAHLCVNWSDIMRRRS